MVKYSETKYWPEQILEAKVVDLTAGSSQTVEDLSRFARTPGEYLVTLKAFSCKQVENTDIYLNVDGSTRKLDVDSMGAGIMQTFPVHIAAKSSFQLKLLNDTSAVTNYPVRYLVEVTEPNIIQKIIHKIALTDDEKKIAQKYNLTSLISTKTILSHNSHPVETNIVTKSWSSSNTLAAGANPQVGGTISVPDNRYGVIEQIWAEGYDHDSCDAITDNYINIQRDLDGSSEDGYIRLNCHAMPPWVDERDTAMYRDGNTKVPWVNAADLKVPFSDKLIVDFENGSAVNYDFVRVGYKYSIYVKGIAEKIKWGEQLLPKEQTLAENKDMFAKVKAGLV